MKNRYGTLGDVGKIVLVFSYLFIIISYLDSLFNLIAFLSAFDAREVTKNSIVRVS